MEFPHADIVDELERCRAKWVILAPEQHKNLLQHWMDLYSEFYSGARRRLRGARAVAEAQTLCCGSFLLIPCRDPSSKGWRAVGAAYACSGSILPDLTQVSHSVDAFISPEDLSWTLLYGHEVDVFGGPEFTRCDWLYPMSAERALKRKWNDKSKQ